MTVFLFVYCKVVSASFKSLQGAYKFTNLSCRLTKLPKPDTCYIYALTGLKSAPPERNESCVLDRSTTTYVHVSLYHVRMCLIIQIYHVLM